MVDTRGLKPRACKGVWVQVPPEASPGDGIGIHVCLRSRILRVQLPSGVFGSVPGLDIGRDCKSHGYALVGAIPTWPNVLLSQF